MVSRQSLLLAASAVVLAAVVINAEPPSSYGPPGYSAPSVVSSSRVGGGGSFFSGGEGGAPEPYNYAYEVKDGPTGNDYSAQANSDGKRVTGEYRVLLPDGRRQIVKYTADEGGYNANVQYEGEARYPAVVPKVGGGGSTVISAGSSGGSSFSGYKY